MEATVDPWVVIEARDGASIVYRDVVTGRRWRIDGSCNRCGSCEVGASVERERELLWIAEPGTAGAVIDLTHGQRADMPVTPDGPADWPGCTLRGEWLS